MKFSLSSLNKQNIKKGLNYLKYNGASGVMSQVRYKMSGPGLAYNNWYKETHEVDAEELERQRQTHFEYEPTISILVPVYMTPEFFLRSMIESVQRQSYPKWQLCLVDGSQADKEGLDLDNEPSAYDRLYSKETEKIIRQYMETDERIKYHLMEENLGISDNTNVAIEMSDGDYIALLDHDDILTDDSLFSVVEALQDKRYDMLYSDEDKMSEDGTKYSNPAFKPDFSIDLIRSYNYIHRFLVVKKKFAISVGSFNAEYDGAQGYEFILRCIEKTDSICHIPRILYHYRINSRSTTTNSHKIEYAREMEKKALQAHIKRNVVYATVGNTDIPGVYKVNYETPGNPMISFIIPGGDNPEVLNRCIEPLFERARYSNFEIIIVDTIGDNDYMLKYYRRIESRRRNIKVISGNDFKNMSELRNYAVSKVDKNSRYLLFLDNNIEIIDSAAIGDMLGICMRDDVGIVSGALYNPNNTVYHLGYVIGINGYFDSLYRGLKRTTLGYLMHNRMNREYSAVSASCMMVDREMFDAVGGFDEGIKDDFAACDFCLKIRDFDRLVVSCISAGWCYHGNYRFKLPERNKVVPSDTENSEENVKSEEIFEKLSDEKIFEERWGHILQNGDPFYNVNFAKDGEQFSLI